MEWQDEGIVLAVRRHGETSAIVDLLTRSQGRHAGLVRGGMGKKWRGVLQPGSRMQAQWRARLAEHLGSYTLEPIHAYYSDILDDALALEALNAICALAVVSLPEREPHPSVFDALAVFLNALDDSHLWPGVMVRWELGLLQELGFRLDLSACAATGTTENLAYVSPRTGRAVSQEAAGPYKERLLPLPGFLIGQNGDDVPPIDIFNGMRLTGYFLDRWVLQPHGQKLPESRGRLMDRLGR